ncbi:MAG: phospholipase D-like domain-containing protein [Sedimenticola sp.]|nr:phospholipase D-like domain-containing protein [Sedimenticola sp.]
MPVTIEHDLEQIQKPVFQVFWGGPDKPPRSLRDLLEKRIEAVPGGGEILWATYYFRDEGLANALLRASSRGVRVQVAIEGNPRTGAVNKEVRKLLESGGTPGRVVRSISHRMIDNWYLRSCRLHEKLYYFSHPSPCALVGTFNPSGNQPEDPDVISKIGDQDRGHNVLVELYDPVLVQGMRDHAERMLHMVHGPWERYLQQHNKIISSGTTRIIFFPRSSNQDLNELFDLSGKGNRLRMAVSHLNDKRVCKRIAALARQGVQAEILAHDTQRRVPSWVEKEMLQSGVTFNRYVHPEGLPMHNKFMLIETPERRILTFGSMNLSVRSLHANHELLVIDENPELYQIFQSRWVEMMRELNS